MVEASTITVLAGSFIGFAIMIVIGVQILGNVQTSTNCATLPGGPLVPGNTNSAKSVATTSNSTGWALSCVNTNTSIQNGYSLLVVAIIVIAAVIIMFVVKML
jgi:hypothetical protein